MSNRVGIDRAICSIPYYRSPTPPQNTPTSYSMGQTTSTPAHEKPSSIPVSPTAKCPVDHTQVQPQATHPKAAQCPVEHGKSASQQPARCPVDHGKLNPLNQMPNLANAPQPGQSIELPTERSESSIPRDGAERWEYPSPQQFYNALVRKGWETPEEHVEVMVEIHNFLNEQAWQEVLKWEKRQYEYAISRSPLSRGFALLTTNSIVVVMIFN